MFIHYIIGFAFVQKTCFALSVKSEILCTRNSVFKGKELITDFLFLPCNLYLLLTTFQNISFFSVFLDQRTIMFPVILHRI